jgi:diguanylate cyclase (GGDEF)-like protein/PAS domain S-box-containing protein
MTIRVFLTFLMMLFYTSLVFSEEVSLQLKWQHQFQFAGYYAALEKGFYKDAGLDVNILEAHPEIDPIEAVINGDAEFGVGTSELLLLDYHRKPLVVLGVIFQHSPLALLVAEDSGIEKFSNINAVKDLRNKPIMIEANSAELMAYFSLEKMPRESLNIVKHSFNIDDLLAGSVAAMSVYMTDEPFEFQKLGKPFKLFRPVDSGIDFYGDNLFTTQRELELHPKRVAAFREASLKGWQYAMAHTEEMVDLIFEQYSQHHSKAHLRFEAEQMKVLLHSDLISPGYMHEQRWEHIAQVYIGQGLLPTDYKLDGFLYRADQGFNSALVKKWGFAALVFTFLMLSFLAYVWRLNRSLDKRTSWLRTVVDNTPSALIIIDKSGRIIEWNYQAEKIFGWSADAVVGESIYDIVVPLAEQSNYQQMLQSLFSDGSFQVSESWSRTNQKKLVLCEWHHAVLQNDRVVAMASDITERKALENKLKEMAHSDALTGVANRTLFFQQLEEAIALAKRRKERVAVLFIDLDDFKIVNDQYGHEVGDVVLCEVVQRIKMAVREADVLARIGGDEFVLILHDCQSAKHAQSVAEKVLFNLERPLQVTGLTVTVGGSIGISMYPDNGEKTADILKSADRAMYAVKQKEKNGVGLAPPRSRLVKKVH